MKTLLNLILAIVVLIVGCTSSEQRNEAASDTASVFDNTRDSSLDTARQAGDTVQSNSIQAQESNGKQSPRTNVGTDTTGKQEHDNTTR